MTSTTPNPTACPGWTPKSSLVRALGKPAPSVLPCSLNPQQQRHHTPSYLELALRPGQQLLPPGRHVPNERHALVRQPPRNWRREIAVEDAVGRQRADGDSGSARTTRRVKDGNISGYLAAAGGRLDHYYLLLVVLILCPPCPPPPNVCTFLLQKIVAPLTLERAPPPALPCARCTKN